MKTAYIANNRVIEIIPEEAHPVAHWYNEEFASHCQEVPDEVMPNWGYDVETRAWLPEREYLSTLEKMHRVINEEI